MVVDLEDLVIIVEVVVVIVADTKDHVVVVVAVAVNKVDSFAKHASVWRIMTTMILDIIFIFSLLRWTARMN